ncbi:MAG: YecA family protein, partial [Alcanivorax sp.]|uniref:YecA/YgfB family protein n=1 Tax=Alcanivorax sp. TaxID=1872427 RepID=UPI003DA75E32
MSDITNPSLKNTVRQYFQDLGEDAPTWTEIHGMLCALAVGPEVETVDYSEELEMPVPEEVSDALNRLRERLVTQLLGGDAINLPCLLDPYQEDDGQDLASWCAGFMTGVFVAEENWYQDDEEQMAQRLLHVILMFWEDAAEALDTTVDNSQGERQMDLRIP